MATNILNYEGLPYFFGETPGNRLDLVPFMGIYLTDLIHSPDQGQQFLLLGPGRARQPGED